MKKEVEANFCTEKREKKGWLSLAYKFFFVYTPYQSNIFFLSNKKRRKKEAVGALNTSN